MMDNHEITYTVGLKKLMSDYQKLTAPAGNTDPTAAIRTLLEIKKRIDGALYYWWDQHSKQVEDQRAK